MLKYEEQLEPIKDSREIFNIIAGVRIIFLITAVFNSTIELGLSLSILTMADTATSIVIGLFITTVVNILLLILYLNTVKEKNNQSTFLVYIVEVLSSAYGILGLYGYIRYIQEIEVVTVLAAIGMIGLIDLIITNVFIGSFFIQGKLNDRLVEIAIFINIIVLILLMFI